MPADTKDFLIVIPARLESSRLPQKLLQKIGSLSILQHVVTRLQGVKPWADLVVATDSAVIRNHLAHMKIEVQMTSPNHKCGTDRCAEIASQKKHPYIINVQGDEPFVSVKIVEELATYMRINPENSIFTLAKKLSTRNRSLDSVVKVLIDTPPSGNAVRFSRQFDNIAMLHHIGIYGFRREAILQLVDLEPTINEKKHRLEQLRWMDNNWSILVKQVEYNGISIDTLEDLVMARKMMDNNYDF